MIRRTLARLTTSSFAALTLVACQDMESPTAPRPQVSAPRFALYPDQQLDQQNLVRHFFSRGNANVLGQSITAGLSGQLTTISIQVYCGREVPDGVLEVYKGQYDWYNTDVIGFSPTAIASQTIPASVWPGCPTETPTWLDVTFDAPASVVAGEVYTFRFVPSSAASIDYPASAATSYAGGSAFSHPSSDILFKTYVLPPTPQLDQQNLVRNFFTRGNANTTGQSFTAGLSGHLTTVSIQVYCGRDIPDGVLEVYKGQYDWYNTDVVGFSPTAIASQPVPASFWPGCPTETPTWLDVAFTAPASVVAGQVYTFRLVVPGGSIDYPGAAATSYAAGWAFAHSSFDILFKTYVLVGSTPADETPPVITPVVTGTLGNDGWYSSNVTVSWTVADAESEISSSGCESITVDTDIAATTFTCSATSAGGTASQSVIVKRDATGPTLNPTVSPDPLLLSGSGSASPGASDAGSGVATASCGAVVTSSVGPKTVTCTATDIAGNVSTRTASYSVYYPFSGFLGGVSGAPMMNSTKAGTSVQFKFNLGGNRGLAILAAGSPMSQSLTCTGGKPVASGTPVTVAGSGPTYDAKSGQYLFTWKTEKAWAGSCRQLILKLADGSEHLAYFTFTK